MVLDAHRLQVLDKLIYQTLKRHAVKPQDIQTATEKYLVHDKMAIIVVGDKSKIADQIKPYETMNQ